MAMSSAAPTAKPTTVPARARQAVDPVEAALVRSRQEQLRAERNSQRLFLLLREDVATTLQRISALPDAPTLNEQGLKGFEVVVWHGVYAPKGTPKEALDKLNAALRAALKDPDVAARFNDLAAQIVPESKQTPAALRDWLKSEIDKWVPVIRKAGVYAD